MPNYLDSLNSEVKAYFKILSPEFPLWLLDYISTPEMDRISKISINCGTDYSKLFNVRYWYSNLEHSVGVALIIWHFTHDKKQTLAGLFHDIATPAFKHCIDFLNGDHEKQESTEEMTTEIIKNSPDIMKLLTRDKIRLDEVCNYKDYPIADNETPQLAADRFEYTFASGLVFHRVWDLDKIAKCYNNVTVLQNEQGLPELGFKDAKICEEYINIISCLWPQWVSNADKIVMQFIADTIKIMIEKGYITIEDLYHLSEQEIINLIYNCPDSYISNAFKKFQDANQVFDSESYLTDKYCVGVKSKTRYVIPLVATALGNKRINEVSPQANQQITDYLNNHTSTYAYFDFSFNPEAKTLVLKKPIIDKDDNNA